jgi:hypothetical protein
VRWILIFWFWGFTQCVGWISWRRFGNRCGFHLHWSWVQRINTRRIGNPLLTDRYIKNARNRVCRQIRRLWSVAGFSDGTVSVKIFPKLAVVYPDVTSVVAGAGVRSTTPNPHVVLHITDWDRFQCVCLYNRRASVPSELHLDAKISTKSAVEDSEHER